MTFTLCLPQAKSMGITSQHVSRDVAAVSSSDSQAR